jgi:hypothetical protein
MPYVGGKFEESKHRRDWHGRFARKLKPGEWVHSFTDHERDTGALPNKLGLVQKRYDDNTYDIRIVRSPDASMIDQVVRYHRDNLDATDPMKGSFRGPFQQDVKRWGTLNPEDFIQAGAPDLALSAGYLKGMDPSEYRRIAARADKVRADHLDAINKDLPGHLSAISDKLTVPDDPAARDNLAQQVLSFETANTLVPDVMKDLEVLVDPSRTSSILDVDNNRIVTTSDAKDLDKVVANYLNHKLGDNGQLASDSEVFKKQFKTLEDRGDTHNYSREVLWEEITRGMVNSGLDLAYKFLWDSVIQNMFFSYFTWMMHSEKRLGRGVIKHRGGTRTI